MKTWTKAELSTLPSAELVTLMREASNDLAMCDFEERQGLLNLLEVIREILAERRRMRLLESPTP